MKMTAKFEAEGESFNACFEQLNSAFNAEFSASGGGQDGKDGATFTPYVSEDGILSWTNDRELPNPEPVNIKGEKGANGKNGFSPIVSVEQIEGGNRVNITDKDGTQSFDVMNGVGGGGVTSWNDLTDKPDFAPIATSGSWNDLTDKPFGEIPPAFDITWDGVIGDKFALDLTSLGFPNSYLVKISDEVFTVEQLIGAKFTQSNGGEFELTSTNIDDTTYPGGINAGGVMIVYSQEELNTSLGLPSDYITNGTYFAYIVDARYTNRLVAPTTIKTLDNKYLDLEGYAKTEDLSAVATSGSYNDLTDKPKILTSYNDLEDRPNLAQIAISGSWNDLQDKPFGEGPSRWVEVVSQFNVTPTQSDKGSYTATVEMLFAPKVDTKYKITVKDGLWPIVVYNHECVGNINVNYPSVGYSTYTLGTSGDPVFAYSSVTPVGDTPTRWTFEFQSYNGQNGYRVEIYEAKPTLILLDEKFLSETVVLESELEEKGYQTEEQVTELINNALEGIENGTY